MAVGSIPLDLFNHGRIESGTRGEIRKKIGNLSIVSIELSLEIDAESGVELLQIRNQIH